MKGSATSPLAIATLWDGSAQYECALLLWCESARKLGAALGRPTQPVVLAPHQSPECPEARYVWRDDTLHALRSWVERTGAKSVGSWRYLSGSTLLKWGVFALTDYEVVLFADLDVDLVPAAVGLQGYSNPRERGYAKGVRWSFADAVDAFAKSKALFVGAPDYASPINTGIFFCKPRRVLHDAALRLMHEGQWDKATGFNGLGTPHSLMRNGSADPAHAAMLLRLQAGSNLSHTEVQAYLERTEMMKQNNWNFVSGNIDQGMFWHILYLLRGVGTWVALSYPRHPYYAEHYWGSPKPWVKNGLPYTKRGLLFLKRLSAVRARLADPVGMTNASRCTVSLTRYRRAFEVEEASYRRGKRGGRWSPAQNLPWRHPVLPAPQIVSFMRSRHT